MFHCADRKEHLCRHSPFPSVSQDSRHCSISLRSHYCIKLAIPVCFAKPLLSTMAGTEIQLLHHCIKLATPRSATEQSDVAMDSSLAVPAGPACPTGSTDPVYAPVHLGTLPLVSQMKWEIHVDFNKDMWWAMPHELADSILEKWMNGAQQVSFIWDWQATRNGSYQPNGADTSINRYIIDFDTMYQRNVDNNRTRKVKVVCVLR